MRLPRVIEIAVFSISGLILSSCGGGGGDDNMAGAPVNYGIGGTVSGLSGTLILQNNGSDSLTLTEDGQFIFLDRLQSGSTYSVTVQTQPVSAALEQTCTVTNGNGSVANSNVSNIEIECVTIAINGIAVPPDPGEAGVASISGVDVDGNGIRDEIDIFIATKFGADAVALGAAQLSARGHQAVLEANPTDRTQSRAVLQENGDIGICAGRAFREAGLSSSRELNEIYLRSFNTEERLLHKRRVKSSAGLFERSITTAVCP